MSFKILNRDSEYQIVEERKCWNVEMLIRAKNMLLK